MRVFSPVFLPRMGPATRSSTTPVAKPTTKLSYKAQRELDGLPTLIESLETEQKTVLDELADGNLYQRDAERTPDHRQHTTFHDKQRHDHRG